MPEEQKRNPDEMATKTLCPDCEEIAYDGSRCSGCGYPASEPSLTPNGPTELWQCTDPQHWRNPETGQTECETCCAYVMDIVMEREKRLASVEPEGATKDFRQTVAERAERDPEFREALVVEREEARVREIAEQVEEVSEKDNADGEPCADCGVVILEHGSDHEWRSAGDAPHIPKPQGCICPWSEADGIAFEDNPYCTIHHPEPQADAPQIPPPPTEDELEAFARKLWCRWVGIPITEPYTKEFTDLLGEVRKMHRDAFTRGLREARRQYGKEGDQNG